MLQLPQELFDAVKNVVLTTRSTGGYSVKPRYERVSAAEWSNRQKAYKDALLAARLAGQPITSIPRPSAYEWTNYWTPFRKSEPFGMLLLNYVHDIVHSMGFEYKGKDENGKFVFEYFAESWLDGNGREYTNFVDTIRIYKNAASTWFVEQFDNQTEQLYEVQGIWTIFSRDHIAQQAGVSVDTVNTNELDYMYGTERDPSTFLCSIFPRWSEDGTDFGTYINCQLANSDVKLSSLINEAGGRYGDYDIRMAALNSCEVPADHKDAESIGNFGECYGKWYETEEEAKAFTFDYDISKPVAVKSFSIEWARPGTGAVNGHYNRYSAYFDLKSNKVVQ
ncbi:MAG: hypothetical protein EBX40_05545 [Gammaproteobacteria bacterium]|nr:hypothetical protein [Gammaproteobacteria bacterium]